MLKNWAMLVLVVCLLSGRRGIAAEGSAAVVWRLAGVGQDGGKYCVGYVAAADQIVLYRGEGEQWKLERLKVPQGKLVPGAPLVLRKTKVAEETPHAGTIGADGRLWEVWGHPSGVKVQHSLPYETRFLPGSDFAVVDADLGPLFFGVDKEGRLHELDLSAKRDVIVEKRADALLPGSPIRTLSKNGNHLYLVDSRGNLVRYVRDPLVQWSSPQLIGTGFHAGGDLVVWRRPDGGRETFVASINARGELKYASEEGGAWRMEIAPGWVLPSGSPLEVFHTPVNLRLYGVNGPGSLLEMHLLNTEWRERVLSPGHVLGSLPHLPSDTFQAFAIDAGGDLLTSRNADEKWTTFLTPGDGGEEKGVVEKREWKPEGAPERLEIRMVNRSTEELTVRLRDHRAPAERKDHVLKAGGEVSLKLDRGTPGKLTTKLKRTLGEGKEAKVTEVTRTRTTAVESLYEVEVLKRGEWGPYLDVRMNRTPVIQSGAKTEISVGNFSLTGDISPRSVTTVDVLKSAKTKRVVKGK